MRKEAQVEKWGDAAAAAEADTIVFLPMSTPFNNKHAEQSSQKSRNLWPILEVDGGSFGCGQSEELDHYEEAAREGDRGRKRDSEITPDVSFFPVFILIE